MFKRYKTDLGAGFPHYTRSLWGIVDKFPNSWEIAATMFAHPVYC